jgi:hypothetical protein
VTHLLDTNVLIEAKNTYYRFGMAPGFWSFLRTLHESDQIASVPAVKQELLAQSDELADWVRALPASFWIAESSVTVDALRSLATWTMSAGSQYRSEAQIEFLGSADYRFGGLCLSGDPAPRRSDPRMYEAATRRRPSG